ncbi:M20/M25/M40 family metallo-hydrolase [Paenibacillus sp. SYP-B3998]|uniref:M20/M25/M40 family metallo-hydrolase n=1 Tax=Paenibacillus sp. SYP-B3998 TaxID=2678564 RepID=A0A6G3ZWU8_9BACL|nr:M20/M25/M40 family metallo-hydrolase [Paenibacillus sp. SYP-B3998]NEW06696.1 M20/M25/M40 family metallo-hydrolase [Paenibacillus sp. SYP-B3998]
MYNLHVIKLGSSTIVNRPAIFEEIYKVTQRGGKVLLVAGGAEGIKQKYKQIDREIPFLTLESGDEVRYCSPEEMPIIRAAYHEFILAKVQENLKKYDLSVFAQCGGENQIVTGQKANPLKVIKNNKTVIVRDSLFGNFTGCKVDFLKSALQAFDVVCIAPPILDPELGEFINIDADMLAAHLAVELEAQHLRFVTSTPGILKDIEDAGSTIQDVYLGDEVHSIKGRMKQKVRAANFAIHQGVCDVCITGPHTLEGTGKTWFWQMERDLNDMDLLKKVARIPSVSKDEHELASYLVDYVRYPGVSGHIDEVGNVVFQKGNGPYQLMLLGHMDTVPHNWQAQSDNEGISGRGVVDAKGCFVNFIEMLKEVEVPEHGSLLVIGAVEEEISSSKGAHFIRDHYRADAVIIGEPSGEHSLTLGYYGLFKLEITIRKEQEHTAAKDTMSVIDQLYVVVEEIRTRVQHIDPQCLSSLIDVKHSNHKGILTVTGILNFRISPSAGKDYKASIPLDFGEDISVQVLRATPGFANPRNCTLVKAFVRSFAKEGKSIHYIKKRGTSDMNTLATTWDSVPMVAYGPGDSSLDHTNHEYLHFHEVETTRKILKEAVDQWFRLKVGE